MSRALSAKDKAFENERANYRREIRHHELVISNQVLVINNQVKEEIALRQQLQEVNRKIREQEDWILRLLEYMDMPLEEIKSRSATEKAIANLFGIPLAEVWKIRL